MADGPPANAGPGSARRIWDFLWKNRYWIVLTGSVVAYLLYVLKQSKEIEAENTELSGKMKKVAVECAIQAETLKRAKAVATKLADMATDISTWMNPERRQLKDLASELEKALSENEYQNILNKIEDISSN